MRHGSQKRAQRSLRESWGARVLVETCHRPRIASHSKRLEVVPSVMQV